MKRKRKATASLSLSLINDNVVETPPSRRTRSQSVPDWSVEETLVLVSEIASLDQDWLKALSSYQKWKMISDSCTAMRVSRSSTQCKRRWESLLSDFEAIVAWESCHGRGSYWSLDAPARLERRLPAAFDQQVFSSIDALLNAQDEEAQSSEEDAGDSGKQLVALPENRLVCATSTDVVGDSGKQLVALPENRLVCATDTDVEADLGSAESTEEALPIVYELPERREETSIIESSENVIETANKLQENTNQIKAIEKMNNVMEFANELRESGEQIHPTETMESTLLMTNTKQENVEQMHVVKENVEQMHVVTILNNTPENNSEKDMEQIHIMEVVEVEDKLEQIDATEKMDIELEMRSKLQRNDEQFYATDNMDIEHEIVSKLQRDKVQGNVDQICVPLQEDVNHIQATQNTDTVLEITDKLEKDAKRRHVQNAEKAHVREKMENLVEVRENTKQIYITDSLIRAQEMPKLMEDIEEIPVTENSDKALDIVKLQVNVREVHEDTNDAVMITNKLQNDRCIHDSERMDNMVEIVNTSQKNVKQVHAEHIHVSNNSMDNTIEKNIEETYAPFMENVEHIHVSQNMDSIIEKNIEKTYALPMENVEHVHVNKEMGSTLEMANRVHQNVDKVYAMKNTNKTFKMANRLHENVEQIRASKNAEETRMMTKNLEENMKHIQAVKITGKALKIANNLHLNAEQIHAVLRGDISEHVKRGRDVMDSAKPNTIETDFTRRRADELIKAFGMFVGILDQFIDLIEDGRCEVIKDVDSLQM